MLIYDFNTSEILRVNKRAVQMYGYSQNEFCQLTIKDIRSEQDIPLLHRNLENIDHERFSNFKMDTSPHQTKKGEILHVKIALQRYEYEGKDARIVHIQDVDETVQLKNRYKSMLRELSHHIDGNPLAMAKYDHEFRFQEWSQTAVEKLGYQRDEVIGKTTFELGIMAKEEETLIRRHMGRLRRGDLDKTCLNTLVNKKNGEQMYIRIHASAFRDRKNRFKSCLVFFEDIDSQSRLENLLKDTQKMAKIGGWEYNPASDELVWTDEVYRIHELSIGEPINVESALQYYNSEGRAKIRECLEMAINEQVKFDEKEKLTTATGNEKWVRTMGHPVKRNGRLYKITGTIQDITEQELQQEEIFKRAEEKEVLLAEIHHRVKNNLAIISGLLELKAMTIDDKQMKGIIRQSQMRIQSMSLIHESLYEAEDFSDVEFSEFLKNLVDTIRTAHMTKEKEINISLDCANSLKLNVNQAIPSGLLMNELITNSFKHAFEEQEKGEIKVFITYEPEIEEVVLQVSDNGKGFPDDFLAGQTKTLGSKLIVQLAKQLGADLRHENRGGAFTELSFMIDEEKVGPSSQNLNQ